MAELTKENLKEVFLDSLEPFARAIQNDFTEVKERLTSLESDSVEIKGRLGSLEGDSVEIKGRLGSLEGDSVEIKKELNSLKGDSVETKERLIAVERDVRWMRDNSGELFTKLDDFISLQRENKQEITILSVHMRDMEKRILSLEQRV